jgi:hypothetical protein
LKLLQLLQAKAHTYRPAHKPILHTHFPPISFSYYLVAAMEKEKEKERKIEGKKDRREKDRKITDEMR